MTTHPTIEETAETIWEIIKNDSLASSKIGQPSSATLKKLCTTLLAERERVEMENGNDCLALPRDSMNTFKIYCSECGQILKHAWRNGHKLQKSMYDSGGISWWAYSEPYDRETGEPKIYRVFTCPSYRRRWYGENRHNICVMNDEGKVEYGIRVKV